MNKMEYNYCVRISSIVMISTFVLYYIAVYYLKPSFVLDYETKNISHKKIMVYSTIVSTFISLLYIFYFLKIHG
jgi:hypothetical protein